MTKTLYPRLRQFASLHRLRIAGLVAVLLVASGDYAFGQASINRTRSARIADRSTDVRRDAKNSARTASVGHITFERLNQITGFRPASDAEVKRLIAKINAAVANHDQFAMRECFDADAFLQRVIAGIEMPQADLDDFQRGFRASSPMVQLSQLTTLSTSNHQLLFSNERQHDQPRFRTVSLIGGLTYNDYVIAAGENGEDAKVVDMFSWICGDYLSLTVRPMALGPLVSARNPRRLPTEGIDPQLIESSEALTDFAFETAKGRFSSALEALDRCPDSFGQQQFVLGLKCNIAKEVSPWKMQQYASEMASLHPNRPGTDLTLLEVARATHQTVDQQQIAERLMKSIDDPFLHYYRVKGLVKAGRIDEARKAMDVAKRAAPTFVDVHVADVELLLLEGDHARTASAIEAVEQQFGDDVLNLASYEGFDAFSESDAGRHLLAKRAGFDF